MKEYGVGRGGGADKKLISEKMANPMIEGSMASVNRVHFKTYISNILPFFYALSGIICLTDTCFSNT